MFPICSTPPKEAVIVAHQMEVDHMNFGQPVLMMKLSDDTKAEFVVKYPEDYPMYRKTINGRTLKEVKQLFGIE